MKTLSQAAKSLLKKLRKQYPRQVFLSTGFGQYRLYVYTNNQVILSNLPDTWAGYDISGNFIEAPSFLRRQGDSDSNNKKEQPQQ